MTDTPKCRTCSDTGKVMTRPGERPPYDLCPAVGCKSRDRDAFIHWMMQELDMSYASVSASLARLEALNLLEPIER